MCPAAHLPSASPSGLRSHHGSCSSSRAASTPSDGAASSAALRDPAGVAIGTRPKTHTQSRCASTPSRPKPTAKLARSKARSACPPSRSSTSCSPSRAMPTIKITLRMATRLCHSPTLRTLARTADGNQARAARTLVATSRNRRVRVPLTTPMRRLQPPLYILPSRQRQPGDRAVGILKALLDTHPRLTATLLE